MNRYSGFYGMLLLWLVTSAFVIAQAPPGYYNSATGTGSVLKTQLYDIIKGHTSVSYDGLWDAFKTTDDRANGKVWDMYSNCTFTFVTDQCGNYSNECDCYNREHSFPSSWFNDATPMYTDLFHIVPTDGKVNNERSNYPFGEVAIPTYTSGNGSKVGPCSFPGYTGTVFEPVDDYKGDFARNYFYMATRYENVVAGWHSNDVNAEAILVTTAYPAYESWFLYLLMKWHYQDPVSQKEIDRNNTIYTSYQHNRNPFIDHPEYAASVWPGYAPYATEPTNHAANFSAHCITLNWADANGTILPVGYLVRMSSVSFANIAIPVDGTVVLDDASNKNVAYGVGTTVFGGLTPNTVYYFKIFGYTGSGTNIDYKTDGTIQQISITAR